MDPVGNYGDFVVHVLFDEKGKDHSGPVDHQECNDDAQHEDVQFRRSFCPLEDWDDAKATKGLGVDLEELSEVIHLHHCRDRVLDKGVT